MASTHRDPPSYRPSPRIARGTSYHRRRRAYPTWWVAAPGGLEGTRRGRSRGKRTRAHLPRTPTRHHPAAQHATGTRPEIRPRLEACARARRAPRLRLRRHAPERHPTLRVGARELDVRAGGTTKHNQRARSFGASPSTPPSTP